MATGYVAPLGKYIAFTNVAPGALAGGQVWTYQNRTTTPAPTYSTGALTIQNSNPVLLDSAGRADIFIPDASVMVYTFVVKDVNGVVVYTENDISIPAVPAAASTAGLGVVPTGGIIAYGGSFLSPPLAPLGYLPCDGASYPVASYIPLHNVIGDLYGTVTTGYFNVPNLQGRFPLGVGVAATNNALGKTGGLFDHVHAGPSHTHTIANHNHGINHTHNVPYNGWTPIGPLGPAPQYAGIIQVVPASASGSESSVTMASGTPGFIVTSAPSSLNTDDKTGFVTDLGGTANTAPANPPFVTVNFIIKT